jgi:hypothetical protein
MYYPYLRGRQFELIALREYALIRGDNNNVTPIIEPVKKTFNSLKLAIPKFIEGDMKFALILNPQVGEIKDFKTIVTELQEQLADTSKWIPAFIVTTNIDSINTEIENNNYNEVMIICSDRADTTSANFLEFISDKRIKYVVSKENRTLKRKLKGKDVIRLDDSFNPQKRNKDFLSLSEAKFTEEHLFYEEDNYAGFSDYTVLISDFIEGGGAPYAVAIHLTYQKDSEEIWIRHFTSISNDDIANIQGKFAEAARKAVNFIDTEPLDTEATQELKKYYDEGKYPGLGIVKKISIKNHLELVNKVISK